MTLGTDISNMKVQRLNNNMEISDAVRDTLEVAKREGRLTCGVYESVKLLEMNPTGVMLCILPANVADDVTMQIHFTLIEAYCWENDIRLMKVDSCDKLAKLCAEKTEEGYSRPPANDNEPQAREDFNCILLEYPTDLSEAEDDVMAFCKMTSDFSPLPIVELPV